MRSMIWMSENNVLHALSTPVPPCTGVFLPRWILPGYLWRVRGMFSACQGIITNRDDSPGANGENSTNIFVFFSTLCCVLFVVSVGEVIPV